MKNPSSFLSLNTLEALDKALARATEEPVVIYKHSNACALSHRARKRLEALVSKESPPVYEVVVQRARDVSNAVEERLGVRHETPQVLLVRDGSVIHHASHSQVDPDAIRAHLAEATTQLSS